MKRLALIGVLFAALGTVGCGSSESAEEKALADAAPGATTAPEPSARSRPAGSEKFGRSSGPAATGPRTR